MINAMKKVKQADVTGTPGESLGPTGLEAALMTYLWILNKRSQPHHKCKGHEVGVLGV